MVFLLSVIYAIVTFILARVFLDATPSEGLIIYFVCFLACRAAFKELKEE
jgi:hypothetical protein